MTTFRVSDPDFRNRIEGSFGRQGFMAFIGAKLEYVEPGRCAISVPFRREVSQQHGFFHGGLVATLVDNAGAYAAFTLIGAAQSMLTVEFKVSLIAPAAGTVVRAVGQVVRAGRQLTTSQVEAFSVMDNSPKKCAIGLVTMMTLSDRGDS